MGENKKMKDNLTDKYIHEIDKESYSLEVNNKINNILDCVNYCNKDIVIDLSSYTDYFKKEFISILFKRLIEEDRFTESLTEGHKNYHLYLNNEVNLVIFYLTNENKGIRKVAHFEFTYENFKKFITTKLFCFEEIENDNFKNYKFPYFQNKIFKELNLE